MATSSKVLDPDRLIFSLGESRFSDLNVISTDGKEFVVHKVILNTITYFRDMLFKGGKEVARLWVDVPFQELDVILRFCYGQPLDVVIEYSGASYLLKLLRYADFLHYTLLVVAIWIPEVKIGQLAEHFRFK